MARAPVDVAGGSYDQPNRGPAEDAPGAQGEDVFTDGGDIINVSSKPFRFNPPLHPLARHVRPDLSGPDPEGTYGQIYDETRNTYGRKADRADRKFSQLRLGRISMAQDALSFAALDSDVRFGFRFLYNPASVSKGANVNANFIPDANNALAIVIQQGLETISFELLLNRMPDVQGPSRRKDYEPEAISDKDMKQIRKRGTHYDLDFLYRVANGVHTTRSRKLTGDIGVLLPNPCNLFLGGLKTWGALMSIQSTDKMFSADMVPMLTTVQVQFARYLATRPSDTEVFESIGIGYADGGSSDSSSDSSSSSSSSSTTGAGGDYEPAPPGAMTGQEVYDLARSVGFPDGEARTMVQIAWGESSWQPSIWNGSCCYGLWQINWGAHVSTLKSKFGAKSEQDLKDPTLNARFAKYLVDDKKARGIMKYIDWEAYTKAGWGRSRPDRPW